LILGVLAVILMVVGLFFVVVWLTGGQTPNLPEIFASETPTPTETSTPLPPTETPTTSLTPIPSETPTQAGPITYIVQEGDSLYSIAEEFEIELDLLIVANPAVEDAGFIFVGQELVIPAPDTELPTPTALPETIVPGTIIEYTVLAGDTLESIAALFNSTAEAIAEENEIEDPNSIEIGDVLRVPVGIATPTPTFTPNPQTATPSPEP
jgi:LysM repeat protein